MRNNVFVVPVCAAITAFVSLIACSSSVPDDGLGGQDITASGKKDSGTTTNKKTDSGAGLPTGNPSNPGTQGDASTTTTGGVIGTGACASNGNKETCYTCCDKAHPNALDLLFQTYGDCACLTPGACKTDCAASFCAGKDPAPNDACDKCLTAQDKPCGDKAEAACAANANCAAYLKCEVDSKCADRAN